MARRCAAVLLIASLTGGCGAPGAQPADMAIAPPDLDGVVEKFAPSSVPLGRAVGSAGQIPHGVAAAKARGAQLDRLVAMHGGYVRRDFLWSALEPEDGVFHFTDEDAAVDDTVAHGLGTIGILAYNVAWATPTHDEHAPPDPVRYAAFVAATVAHFRGRVTAWEIWNEPNAGYRFWLPREDAAAYAQVLAAGYAAAKAADPNAPVLFAGLFYHDEGIVEAAEAFLVEAYTARPDLGRFFDALALHPYPRYPPQAAPEASDAKERPVGVMVARVRALLAAYGDGAKPIWVTEYGWPVYGTVDEATQARYLVRGTVLAQAAGCDRVAFYTLVDGPNPKAFPPEDAFGILHGDGSPKPSYRALATLTGIDPAAILVADDSAGAVRSYRYAGPAAHFHVLWSSDGAPHTVAVTVGGNAMVLDGQGQPMAASPSALPVAADPIYVVERP